MSNTMASCGTCGGRGSVRQTHGFFTIEKPCPNCRSEEVARQSKSTERSGYVYILYMTAGILKIGHTRRHPEDRANEWGLTLLAFARAEDSGDAERRMHEHLSRYRKGAYELFEMSFDEAIVALARVVGEPTIVRSP